MFFPQFIIDQVKDCGFWSDRLIRSELISGVIVTENDYTSNFTAAFRREINSRCIPGLRAHSQVLAPNVERQIGADGCIVLMNNRECKIGVFEAKWPRLSKKINSWDSLQKSSKVSHFDSQIKRQSNYINQYAIWEMFYLEEPFYSRLNEFPPFGSSCVWHDDAAQVSNSRSQTNIWTDSELLHLLSSAKVKIEDVLQAICECSQGSAIPIQKLKGSIAELGFPDEILIIEFDQEDAPQGDA
ncbi:hypothetical protein ACFL2E_04400 [Thermodesulfobacteriota bacterium]